MRRNLATLDRDIHQYNRILQEAMAHGIENDMIYGGLEPGQLAVQALSAVSLTKNCAIGSRRVTIDGDVYRYGKGHALGVSPYDMHPGYGCFHGNRFKAVSGGVVSPASSGDMTLDILLDSESGAAEWFGTLNQMRGGLISGPSGGQPFQIRRIASHPAKADGQVVVITLREPLTRDVVATQQIELLQNPYGHMYVPMSNYHGCVGVPFTDIAALYHGWVLTWGLTWLTPGEAGIGSGLLDRTVCFMGNGAITQANTVDWGSSAGKSHQIAGFIVDYTASGDWDNPPMIMVQICP